MIKRGVRRCIGVVQSNTKTAHSSKGRYISISNWTSWWFSWGFSWAHWIGPLEGKKEWRKRNSLIGVIGREGERQKNGHILLCFHPAFLQSDKRQRNFLLEESQFLLHVLRLVIFEFMKWLCSTHGNKCLNQLVLQSTLKLSAKWMVKVVHSGTIR